LIGEYIVYTLIYYTCLLFILWKFNRCIISKIDRK